MGGLWSLRALGSPLDFVITGHPANIHHILSRNFSNYHKGPKFREVFEPLEDGIFASDSDSWRFQRKLIQSMIKNKSSTCSGRNSPGERWKVASFQFLITSQVWESRWMYKMFFERYTFDNVCFLVLGFDPNCLSIEFAQVAHAKAFDQMEQSVLYRHIVPESCWKLKRWLQIGEEKKLSSAWKIFDQFVYQWISSKREQLSRSKTQKMKVEVENLLTACIEQDEGGEMDCSIKSNKFMRDMAFSLIAAGRDTISSGLTWFLWLVATHPSVEANILQEMREHLLVNNEIKWGIDEVSKLVYPHGAICESLRLFPPVPFEHLLRN